MLVFAVFIGKKKGLKYKSQVFSVWYRVSLMRAQCHRVQSFKGIMHRISRVAGTMKK